MGARERLERRDDPGPVRVREHQRRVRLEHGRRGDVQHAPEAALAHPGHDQLDQLDRRQHELAVRLLPLLAGEAERVAAGRAAGVRDEDVDRTEVRPRRCARARARRRGRACRARRAVRRSPRPPPRRAPCVRELIATRAPSAASSLRDAEPDALRRARSRGRPCPLSPRSTARQAYSRHALYGRSSCPACRLLLRVAPFLIGALAAAVWLERRRHGQAQLAPPLPAPELEPVAPSRTGRFERKPAPEPIDIVTVVDDLLSVGR